MDEPVYWQRKKIYRIMCNGIRKLYVVVMIYWHNSSKEVINYCKKKNIIGGELNVNLFSKFKSN